MFCIRMVIYMVGPSESGVLSVQTRLTNFHFVERIQNMYVPMWLTKYVILQIYDHMTGFVIENDE